VFGGNICHVGAPHDDPITPSESPDGARQLIDPTPTPIHQGDLTLRSLIGNH
jgi:hypothetical protein